MSRPVHCEELVDRDVGVDLRRLDVGVAEHLLDEADVGATFEHVRRAGMTQQVRAAELVHAGELHVALDLLRDEVRPHRLAVVGEEERCGVGRQELGARLEEVLVEPLNTPRPSCAGRYRCFGVPARRLSRSFLP